MNTEVVAGPATPGEFLRRHCFTSPVIFMSVCVVQTWELFEQRGWGLLLMNPQLCDNSQATGFLPPLTQKMQPLCQCNVQQQKNSVKPHNLIARFLHNTRILRPVIKLRD